ncbi:MAG: anti-sigma factor [Pyrinomonadaceae bacterium]
MDKRDEKNEILAAFALGSLDEIEARKLAAQIESDAELAAELEKWRDVAANLAFIAPEAKPAPTVRENILAAIRKTPQNSSSEQSATNGATKIEKAKIVEQPEESLAKATVLSFPARSRTSFWSFAPAFSAVAASVIAVLLAIALYNTAQSNKVKTDKISELNQKIIEAQTQLERERQERELLISPATFIKALNGTKELPTAKARLVFDPKTGQALLYVEGLPAAPQGKAYQIWFISDPKHPAPGKTFGTDDKGKGILRDEIPVQALKAEAFAITLEPESGSAAPTTLPLLVSPVS